MTNLACPATWASAFGLADAPLFGCADSTIDGQHRVMLDGGAGSFVLSIGDTPAGDAASWAWSANISHHVVVHNDTITVGRWDRPRDAQPFAAHSVARQMPSFYDYLLRDRPNRSASVISHLISLFRAVRGAAANLDISDDLSLPLFLLALDNLSSKEADFALAPFLEAPYRALKSSAFAFELERARRVVISGEALGLHAPLSVRHAGGLIFQEAHFELLRPPSLDMFGVPSNVATTQRARGGAHFTPPSIARSIVEQTLAQIHGLKNRPTLTILDPACGSGAFLHEALRALERVSYGGRVTVVGRDISASAVAMANYVLLRARDDWPVAGQIILDLQVADSLATPLPTADVVVMNPPFIAASTLSLDQRDQLREVLGKSFAGRADFSMAFITKGLSVVANDGALGCLMPASLLSLDAADKWRKQIADEHGIALLALLGDYGLFEHALVRVAAAVLTKQPTDGIFTAIWTGGDTETTSEAMRSLRQRTEQNVSVADQAGKWAIYTARVENLAERKNWLLRSPVVDNAVAQLRQTLSATVGSLFDVRQGISTGNRSAFIVSEDELFSYPQAEHKWFRPAILKDAIRGGRIHTDHYIFYPYNAGNPVILTEEALKTAVPKFYESKLQGMKSDLMDRPGAANADLWWNLNRHRVFDQGSEPRIVSKYFGGRGSFVIDDKTGVAVVQGKSWYPKGHLIKASKTLSKTVTVSRGYLDAYVALFNSVFFESLLHAFCDVVAGGQYDLSARYVDPIPLPDFGTFALGEERLDALLALDALGKRVNLADNDWVDRVEANVLRCYGLVSNPFAATG
jgi:adenine-specific DNA-methyltransferase